MQSSAWRNGLVAAIAPQYGPTDAGVAVSDVRAVGEQLLYVYNDAYRPILGARHPDALGQSFASVWPELVDSEIMSIIQRAMQGESAFFENMPVTLTRNGYPEQTWFTFSYSPVCDDTGQFAGVVCICTETTAQILAERARDRAEAELRDSEDHYRHTVELNPHVQWTALPDGQLDRVSQRWRDWTGTSGLGQTWNDAVHPDDRERVFQAWNTALATGAPYDIELRSRMLDGAYYWVHSRAYPRRDESGKIVKWYGTTQNINDLKQALEELAAREREFRTLAEAMPNHAWVANSDGNIFWFNQRVYEYTGVVSGGLDGNMWIKVVHPDDLPGTLAHWQMALNGGTTYQNEFRLREGATGEWRWFISRALPLRDDVGRITRWIGTNTDVHEQKLGSEQLADLNAHLEKEIAYRTAERDRMWRLSTDIMLVARFDSTILSTNPAWFDLLGWEEHELKGRPFMELIHPDDLDATLAEAGRLAHGIKTLRFENRYRHRDGSYRWLSWTAVPDESFIHALARDITEQKRQAETLQHTEQALRQAQKMEAVGQLTGGIAHDFNNLLAGMVGNLEILQFRLDQGQTDNLTRYIEGAQSAADRAATLTQRLLAFSRQQMLAPKPVSVNQLVGSLKDLLQRTVGPGIVMRTELAEDIWATLCDANQLESAVLNLVINARDAMDGNGLLTIVSANVSRENAAAGLANTVPDGQYVTLSVIDDGSGMPPDVLSRAFDPFFTTKPQGQGTGLGLSMVYGFVTQSGGHVRIDSVPDAGTTVKLYLPRHLGSAVPETAIPAGAETTPPIASRGRIMVVEDEEDIRHVLTEMLAEWGYSPIPMADTASALAILDSDAPLDLLVTDIGLPGGMNGRQLAQHARVRRPDLKVLYLTGFVEDSDARTEALEGSTELVTKPFALDLLARRINAMLAS
ncbi:hypothetical protein ASE07_11085 [Noviherbaspirillum sp. Root189]|nr:hypothetical protein ASE07_11085 [Noviherbaspirillum sp. Root189]